MQTYPARLAVRGPNATTVQTIRELVKDGLVRDVAELGVYRGHTTLEIAKALPSGGNLDIFDYLPTVSSVSKDAQRARPDINVRPHGNSSRYRDSYCWSLRGLLATHREPIWDYVYIDGAHTWDVDGFAFLLCDMLLRPGGYVDFDDYHWTLAGGTPGKLPFTRQCYTTEQMQAKQVASIVELLVPRLGYETIIPRKVFRKCRE